MSDLSKEEMEIIKIAGLELLTFLHKMYQNHKAKGVDLEALLEKARANNQLTIMDENV